MKHLRKLRFDLFLIIILLSLSIFAWRQLPELVIRGDGFVYMVNSTLNEFFSRKYWYTGFETSAAVLGTILPKLYKTNISLYFYTSLTVMMLINIIFYVLLRVITKHKIISFFGALLFATNYFGNLDMYSQHCYCFFMERVVTAPFLLASFIFLHRFLEKNNFKFYGLSLLFYFIGQGIGHFALLFTPPFVLYPFFWKVFGSSKNHFKKNLVHGIFLSLSFFAVSVFIVFIQQIHQGQRPKSMVQYLLNPGENRYPEKILRQFVYWTQYEPVIRNIDGTSIHRYLDIKNAEQSMPYIFALYFTMATFIYIKGKKMQPLLFTTIFGTITIFFLNAWFGQYDVLYQSGANRYLYFPTFLLAIFWTLLLWLFWMSKHMYAKLLVLVIVMGYYFLNFILISDTFKDILSWDKSTKAIYKYMTIMRSRLPKNTLVVAPYPEVGVYESHFFTQQIGKGEVEFIAEEHPYRDWKKVATLSAQVIKLHYDKKCDCVREEKIK